MQFLISQGHNWKDIKQYHLGEIGVFIRAAVKAKRDVTDEKLWMLWYAGNADQKDITKLSKSIKGKTKHDSDKIKKDVGRLKGLLGGL